MIGDIIETVTGVPAMVKSIPQWYHSFGLNMPVIPPEFSKVYNILTGYFKWIHHNYHGDDAMPGRQNSIMFYPFRDMLHLLCLETVQPSWMKEHKYDCLQYMDPAVIVPFTGDPAVIGKVFLWMEDYHNPVRNAIIRINTFHAELWDRSPHDLFQFTRPCGA